MILFLLAALSASWQFTPLSEWISIERITSWERNVRGNPFLPLGVLAAFVVGGIVFVPVTVLVGITALLFNPLAGIAVALTGVLLNALATYGIGVVLGKKTIPHSSSGRIQRLRRLLKNQGIMTIALIRNFPAAPFSLVNIIAGASGIRLKNFLLGTALGMSPGIVLIMVLADRIVFAVQNPGWKSTAAAIFIFLLFLTAAIWIKHKTAAKMKDRNGSA